MRSARGLWGNAALLVVSSLVAFALAETGARLITRGPGAPKRCLLWSEPNFELDAHGVARFAANARVREVAVYGGAIEYDRVYRTNDLGFVDSIDYAARPGSAPATRRYAFVGDSFTAGSGGYAWPAALRDRLERNGHPVAIYNLGLPGAGARHFAQILQSAADSLSFTDIVIVAISNDLRRPPWTPRTKNGRVLFRFNVDGQIIPRQIATVIPFAATPAEILQRAGAVKAPGAPASPKGSRLFSLIREAWPRPAPDARAKPALNVAPLRRIRGRFPEAQVSFVHLPGKEEVRAGRYDRELRAEVEALGITYLPALAQCRWSSTMFYPHDAHPNERGYQNIEDCVGRLLFGRAGRGAP